MPFTTLTFIVFFIALFLAYYAVPRHYQWWLLLVGSQFFYGYFSLPCLILLWTTILITFCCSLAIGNMYAKRDECLQSHQGVLSKAEKKACNLDAERAAKRWLMCALVILLVLLGIFKYAQFAIDNFLALVGLSGRTVRHDIVIDIFLPVGFSFYLFQSIGYCIDVYREEVVPEHNPFKYALFVSFFPQILQGPIGNFGRLSPQLLGEHTFDYDRVKTGALRAAWGFFKKLVIANCIAGCLNPVWTSADNYSGFATWFFFCLMYAIQLYADFSGYMDIACGCSRMLGITIDENFNCPYFSKTVSEFWRRWHITLGDWFRIYLFYPILRSGWNSKLRKSISNKYLSSVVPTSIALAIVWFLTGLWHGASWGYVAWGVYYGLFMILAVVLSPVYDRVHALAPNFFCGKLYASFQMLRTFLIVVVGYSIFKPADLCLTVKIWDSALSHFGFGELIDMIVQEQVIRGWLLSCAFGGGLLLADGLNLCGVVRPVLNGMNRRGFAVQFPLYVLFGIVLFYFGVFFPKVIEFEYFKF